MQCRDAQEALNALLDGEIAAEQQQAARAHVVDCPLCTERAREYRRIGDQLRTYGRVAAPNDLADRIRVRLSAEDPASTNARFGWRQFARQAAVLAIVAGLSGVIGWQLAESTAQKHSLEREVLVAHARSLLQDSPVQIASSQGHTVRPWFNGRLEFAPTVKDLTAEGFPLIGGRVDLVDGRRTAALVYKRRAHLINVFIWPAASRETTPPMPASLEGYNVISWKSGGLAYWAVSDLNAKELAELQALL